MEAINNNNVLVAIYGHPEGYPPTLNAVSELSTLYKKVILVGRNVLASDWNYPENCTILFSGPFIQVRDAERVSILKKIILFADFLKTLFKTIKKEEPTLILLYDPIALFAFFLVKKTIKKVPAVWYHNHDVFEEDKVRKYSIQWMAGMREKKSFRFIDIFSLPSEERKNSFNLIDFSGRYFFIPNFPSVNFFGKYYQAKGISRDVKLIFQGAISEGHGLEEIARLPAEILPERYISLVVKGWIRDQSFKEKLIRIAGTGIGLNRLEFIEYGPYKDLPLVTSSCHIGIGIHSLNNELHSSLGKASNKLYEYASVGLPIIVFDSPHYRYHLEKFSWVFFTDLSAASLTKCIHDIVENYSALSQQAHEDFLKELNFELNFHEVALYLKKNNQN